MNKEYKELLLKDLSSRLPYGVMISHRGLTRPLFSVSPTQHFQITLDNAINGEYNGLVYVSLDAVDDVKPYLRPMSSMTEEEKREYASFIGGQKPFDSDFSAYPKEHGFVYEWDMANYVNWLNSHHFDYRGLIEKGLAIEAHECMYKYNKSCDKFERKEE